MKKLQSSLVNMVLVLGLISAVAATLLAWVNGVTAEPIAKSELAKQEAAIREVSPEFNNSPVADVVKQNDADGEEVECYPAFMDSTLVGVAVKSYSNNGFNGQISVMFGFLPDGRLYNYSVLKQGETPGLGTKMVTWFKTEKGHQDIRGRDPKGGLKVSKDGGDIDAITAATISSRAFMDAANRAYEVFEVVNKQWAVADTLAMEPVEEGGAL